MHFHLQWIQLVRLFYEFMTNVEFSNHLLQYCLVQGHLPGFQEFLFARLFVKLLTANWLQN